MNGFNLGLNDMSVIVIKSRFLFSIMGVERGQAGKTALG